MKVKRTPLTDQEDCPTVLVDFYLFRGRNVDTDERC